MVKKKKDSSAGQRVKKEDVEKTSGPSVNCVHEVADKIFNAIIAPICSVPGVGVNIYTAKLADYDKADPKNRKEILDKIIDNYKIRRNVLEMLQEYPLALIALYIVDKEEKC